MKSDMKLKGNAVIVEGSLGLDTTDPTRPMHVEHGELHSGGRPFLGRGEHPMTVENEGSNETPASEDEAGPILPEEHDVEVTPRVTEAEEKKLRIVLQVEMTAETGDGKKTDVNKISVVSEHIRAVIRIIGGAAE